MAKKSHPSNRYLRLESRIAADERGGVLHRWQYGRALVAAKAGRRQLPHGMLADLVAAATRAGYKLSEREIRRRIQCATVYDSEAKVGQALADFGSWSALAEAGFPAVDITVEPEDLEAIGEPDPYGQEPLFEVPGFKPVLRINGRKVALADATVRDAIAYRDMCRDMHASFGRTVEHVEESVDAMLAGADGDLDANALHAWRRTTGQG